MKKLDEIGTCPNCNCSIHIYKTSNYKRFAKCEICGFSYSLPKAGKISNSSLLCSKKELPILIIERSGQRQYYWTDGPCFTCVKVDKCTEIKELKVEFEGVKINES